MIAQTYGEIIRQGTTKLRAADIDSPAHNVRLIVQTCAGKSATDLILCENEALDAEAIVKIETALQERIARRPLQHILGIVDFFGLRLKCDSRALIPRTDSECVVEAALSKLPKDFEGVVADLGTGSGCLLGACLSARKQASGVAVEASARALSLARENFEILGLESRITPHHSTWQKTDAWHDADLILSNPPYIETKVVEGLEPEVRNHDPMNALDGGADGLDAYRSILAYVPKLKPGAWVVFEIGYDQRASVLTLMETSGLNDLGASKDLNGQDRALWGRVQ